MTTTTSAAAQIRFLKQTGGTDPRLILAEHEGTLWATNSFWLCDASRFAGALAKYNLELTPGVYRVNGTIAPRDVPPPNLSFVMPSELWPAVEPVKVAGRMVATAIGATDDVGGDWGHLFGDPDAPQAVKASYVRWIAGSRLMDVAWHQERHGGPIAFYDGGTLLGLAMPFRLG